MNTTDTEKRLADLEKENAILWKRIKKIESVMEIMADTVKKLSLRMKFLYDGLKGERGKIVTMQPKGIIKV